MGAVVVTSESVGRRMQDREAETKGDRRGTEGGAVGVAPRADQGTVPA